MRSCTQILVKKLLFLLSRFRITLLMPGVDFFAIGRALFFNIREQRIVSGASTITQQLVRNMIGKTTNRDIWDKALEAMYAVRISNVYSKDEILELYLNTIYYGNMAYGV